MTEATAQPQSRPALDVPSYAYFSLALLFLVSFFNYMDRYMLAVLLPAIKEDLNLSDTQIGFITGFAFTIVYALGGIPIARLADKYSRAGCPFVFKFPRRIVDSCGTRFTAA